MSIETGRGRTLAVAAVAVAVVALAALGYVVPALVGPGGAEADTADRGPGDVKTVSVVPNDSATLWPYTSRRPDFDTLTLPINVVVQGHPSRVRYLLAEQTDARWNATAEEWEGIGEDESVASNGSDIPWSRARGSTRYTYIHVPEETRRLGYEESAVGGVGWTDATYQLHDGDYFGTRYHLRLYGGGSGDRSWTAIQAHHEHWDWFRLRHTVGSLAKAQRYVERGFFGDTSTADVRRERYANGGISDTDGWVTVVELEDVLVPGLLAGVVLPGLAIRRDTVDTDLRRLRDRLIDLSPGPRISALFVSTALLPLYVRTVSIGLERTIPNLPPKLIAAAFYPVLVVGLPVCAGFAARGLTQERAFPTALLGLGTGLLADYAYLGISVLPIGVIVHRLALVTVLGLIAAGSARRAAEDGDDDPVLLVSVVAWIVVLGWPLLGL